MLQCGEVGGVALLEGFPMTVTRLIAAMLLALAATAVARAETPTLTISVYGIAQDVFKRDLYEPFEAVCGCKLSVEIGNSSERLAKLEANRAAPVIDVAALADFNALEAARNGLIAPIDVTKLANHASLYDIAKDPIGDRMGVGYTFYATSIVYRADKVSVASWNDLFKPELAGRIALPNITTTQGPLALYMIDKAAGGTTADLKAGMTAVAKNRGNVVTFYERGSQIPQLFEQEEILAAVIGRFGWANLQKIGMPIKWASPREGQTGGLNVLTLVKGSRNEALALKFIDFWLSREVQTRLANHLVDSPANKTVEVDPKMAEALTYGPAMVESLNLIAPGTMLENRDAWLAAWNAGIAR
jgi:putative spermidine/putrescine transport system substrate-binding protein